MAQKKKNQSKWGIFLYLYRKGTDKKNIKDKNEEISLKEELPHVCVCKPQTFFPSK